jgi:hypothetical protein
MRAEPRSYFFFLGGAFAVFAGDFGAAFAPAFADDPLAEGFEAEPLFGAFAAALAGALAAAFAGAFAAGFAGALAAGLGAAAFGGGTGTGAGAGAGAVFTTGRGPPVRRENAPGR